MELNQLSVLLAKWLDEQRGIFVFSSMSKDEWLYQNFIEHVLSFTKSPVYKDTYRSDLSHIEGKSNSIFVDNLMNMKYDWALDSSMNTYLLHKKLIGDLREKLIQNSKVVNSQVIFTPMYHTMDTSQIGTMPGTLTGGSSIIFMADVLGIIYENQFSVQKCRWRNTDEIQDINLKVLLRDLKIDKILK